MFQLTIHHNSTWFDMNKKIVYTIFLSFCFIAALMFLSDSNGLVVKMRTSKDNKQSRTVFYFKKNRLKIVTENKTILFSKNRISFLDHKKRTYWESSIKEFNKEVMKYRLSSENPYSEKSHFFYQNLAKKDKVSLKRISHGDVNREKTKNVKSEIFLTPDFTSIAGYAARKYEIRQNDEIVEEVWIAENLKNYLKYDLNLDLYHDYMNSFLQHSESKLYYHLESFMEVVENGFPMKIIMYGKGPVTETLVENLIKRDLEDSAFLIPEDYQLSDLKSMID